MHSEFPTNIGGITFETRQQILIYTRMIRDRTSNEQPLSGHDAEFVADLFRRHAEYAARTRGRTVSHFMVSTAMGGTRCFYTVYADGEIEDFSDKKCI